MNEIIAKVPWAFLTFALATFSGLAVLIAYFARLGAIMSGVERNLTAMRDEMRLGFSLVDRHFSRMGERLAGNESRADGWFEAHNVHVDE